MTSREIVALRETVEDQEGMLTLLQAREAGLMQLTSASRANEMMILKYVSPAPDTIDSIYITFGNWLWREQRRIHSDPARVAATVQMATRVALFVDRVAGG